MSYARVALVCLITLTSCSRSASPPSPPSQPALPASGAPPAAAPAPAPTTTTASDAAALELAAVAPAPEPELPAALRACHRKCSSQANHRQMQGFVRCERDKKGPDCKTAVLTANDAERAACRQACEAKQ
jgi:hypothetical protein